MKSEKSLQKWHWKIRSNSAPVRISGNQKAWSSMESHPFSCPTGRMACGHRKGSQIIWESTRVKNRPVSRQRQPVRHHGIPGCCAEWERRSVKKRCITAWTWFWDRVCAWNAIHCVDVISNISAKTPIWPEWWEQAGYRACKVRVSEQV